MQPSTTRSACRRGKAKWPDGAQSTSEASAAYLRVPAGRCRKGPQLAAPGKLCYYLHELSSEQGFSVLGACDAHAIPSPETATSLAPQPCSPCCLHTASAGAIYRARRTCFCSIFHLPSSPDSKVCCCAFPLRPVQGGKLRFSRASADTLLASAESPGEMSWHMQLLEQDKVERPFTIAARRCARRSIPDSRRIHHPPARYRPATS